VSTYHVHPAGSDANDGLTPDHAFASIARGLMALRDGDELLLARGGAWDEALTFVNPYGRPENLIRSYVTIGAYGSGPRPRLNAPWGVNGVRLALGVKIVAFDGLHLETTQPGNAHGIFLWGSNSDIVIRDCVIRGFSKNICATPNHKNGGRNSSVQVIGCIITDATAQGIFADATDDLVVKDCVLDRNGGTGSTRNHGAYITTGCGPIIFRRNVVSRSSATGIQARSGGIIEDNVFDLNPIAITFGYVLGNPPKTGGVSGVIRNNRITRANDIGTSPRRWGIQVANINKDGAFVEGNQFSDAIDGRGAPLIVSIGNGHGIERLWVHDNDFRGGAVTFQTSTENMLEGAPYLGEARITGNRIDTVGSAYQFQEHQPGYAFDPGSFTFAANKYTGPRLAEVFAQIDVRYPPRSTRTVTPEQWRALTGEMAD
jgi:hypothetical protein